MSCGRLPSTCQPANYNVLYWTNCIRDDVPTWWNQAVKYKKVIRLLLLPEVGQVVLWRLPAVSSKCPLEQSCWKTQRRTKAPPLVSCAVPVPPVAPLCLRVGPPFHLAHLNSNMGDLWWVPQHDETANESKWLYTLSLQRWPVLINLTAEPVLSQKWKKTGVCDCWFSRIDLWDALNLGKQDAQHQSLLQRDTICLLNTQTSQNVLN